MSLNSYRCFSFRISLPATHQSSKTMRTTPPNQTLFLFGEGSGRSFTIPGQVWVTWLALALADLGRRAMSICCVPGAGSPDSAERVAPAPGGATAISWGSPKASGRLSSIRHRPDLLAYSLYFAPPQRGRPCPRTCPYLRAPPPSSPRTPGAVTAKKTQSRPAAPMPRRQPQRRDAWRDT